MGTGALQKALGHVFRDPSLLEQALTHRSHGMPHNERLEFLGDSVLNFIVTTLLYARHSGLSEGDLSRVRANLVRQSALAEIAVGLSLSDYLRLGEGELKSGGFRRPSILADALEAVLGAVFLDAGYEAVRAVIEGLYQPLMDNIDLQTFGKDAKTLLQEIVQGQGHELPRYTVLATQGAAHKQTFTVLCEVPGMGVSQQASGSSRRSAEQAAASLAIEAMQVQGAGLRAARRGRKHVRTPAAPGSPLQEKK